MMEEDYSHLRSITFALDILYENCVRKTEFEKVRHIILHPLSRFQYVYETHLKQMSERLLHHDQAVLYELLSDSTISGMAYLSILPLPDDANK